MKTAKAMAKHPSATRRTIQIAGPPVVKAAKPFVKRRVRQRVQRAGDTARVIGETLAVYGPQAAQELGLVEPPKQKRTVPWLATGIVIGASAMYLLEPGHGREHREKLASLVA